MCAKEVDRFVPGNVGQVAHTAIGLSDFIPFFGPVFVVVEHVKHLSHCILVLQGRSDSVGGNAEFADQARAITRCFKSRRVGDIGECALEGWSEEGESVASFIDASEIAGSACSADWTCAECVFEPNTACGKLIDVRGFDDWIASTAEQVIALVVGEEKEDVRGRRVHVLYLCVFCAFCG